MREMEFHLLKTSAPFGGCMAFAMPPLEAQVGLGPSGVFAPIQFYRELRARNYEPNVIAFKVRT